VCVCVKRRSSIRRSRRTYRLVGAAVRGAPQASDAGSDARVGVGLRGARHPHGGGGGVLLVVHVQNHDHVHRARQHRVWHPLLRSHARRVVNTQ